MFFKRKRRIKKGPRRAKNIFEYQKKTLEELKNSVCENKKNLKTKSNKKFQKNITFLPGGV